MLAGFYLKRWTWINDDEQHDEKRADPVVSPCWLNRQNALEKQRAMPRLVQSLHAAGKKDTEISRFCGLSQRTVLLLLAREI